MSEFPTYQGGIPPIYTRYRGGQRGSGFFSTLKRFLVPLARSALPHAVSAVADVIGGREVKETLKERGIEAGRDALTTAASTLAPPAAPKKYKRKAPPVKKKKAPPAKKRRTNQWS